MAVQEVDRTRRFADRIADMLDRVEHRPALSPSDLNAAYRLRYDAYLRQNLLNARLDEVLYDEVYDKSPNALTTLTYIEGELASTVRVHIVKNGEGVSPACDVFSDVLAERLKREKVMIDPSRLAAHVDVARRYPELPYFAIRPAWMAAHHFSADFIILSCAIGHVGYYKRTFRAETWSDLRSYPKVTAKVVCIGFDFVAKHEVVEARFPSFRSTVPEREALFKELGSSLRATEGGAAASDSLTSANI